MVIMMTTVTMVIMMTTTVIMVIMVTTVIQTGKPATKTLSSILPTTAALVYGTRYATHSRHSGERRRSSMGLLRHLTPVLSSLPLAVPECQRCNGCVWAI